MTIFFSKIFSCGFHSLVYPLFIDDLLSYTRTYNCDNAVRGPPTLSQSLFRFFALSCSPTSHEALFSIYRRQKEQFPGYLFVFRDQVHKNNLWLDFDKDLWSWNFFIPSPQQSKTHEMQFGLVLLNRWQVTAERNSCIACLGKISAIN